ncbi:hypothetical protein LguiA_025346 [Lonicera macranthoides]
MFVFICITINYDDWKEMWNGVGETEEVASLLNLLSPVLFQFFSEKEREIEIGYPTDVKHVAHIGWDGPSGSAPSWMNEFKTGPDFAATSIGKSGSTLSPWSSQDYGESMGRQMASEMFSDIPTTDPPSIPKKHKRKKLKSGSSASSSSTRPSRLPKSKAKFVEDSVKSQNIEVA